MKKLNYIVILSVLVLMVSTSQAGVADWKVATVHGYNQFTISQDSSSLLYQQQPRNDQGWYWYQNNGSAEGILATGGKQTPEGYRDGSRTFATTDIAAGKTLSDIKLAFQYNNTLGQYPTMNFFLTDGNGKFGIFSPASGGINAVSTQVVDGDWTQMTLDLTGNISDIASVAIYEHNGFTNEFGNPYTSMTWGDIKDYTIAGMYDYQRSPELGWGAWGTMFDQINAAGDSEIVNGYGLALIWGDTVGNDAYTTQQREIRDVVVTFDDTDFTGTFSSAQVPEPTTIALLGLGGLALIRRKRSA